MILRRVITACVLLALTCTGTVASAQQANQKLKESMGWLIGKKWEGTGEAKGEFPVDKFTTQERFHWVCDKQFIEQRWTMKERNSGKIVLSGLIIYGWDYGANEIKSWGFGSRGDVGGMVLESCRDGTLVWKGHTVPLQEGPSGKFTYTQKRVNGEYHIDFKSESLTAKQYLHAAPGAEFSFKNANDSQPNDHIANWGRFMAGGTWTTTIEGKRQEHPYRWILNKNFLYNPRTGDPYAGLAILGYDPLAKKLTFWHFDNSGLFGQSRITRKTDTTWQLKGEGCGPDGKQSWVSTLVRHGKRKLEERDVTFTIGDEKRTDPDAIWVREPAKKK